MKDILLTELLEAGCHFGHRKERWHPKAAEFIFQTREGIHIIDLAKTKAGLVRAGEFLKDAAKAGKSVLFVATKRQAKGVVTEAAKRAGIFYLTNRWIGGFLTNWEEIKKNLDKVHKMRTDKATGAWHKFPKHEIVKLEKHLRQLESVYSGVADLKSPPETVFLVDIRRESNCRKEIQRREATSIAIVDTNADPNLVDYPIPANDDAVGSIQFIVNYLADAYTEGKEMREKEASKKGEKVEKVEKADKEEEKKEIKSATSVRPVTPVKKETASTKVTAGKEEKPKRRGRPKKSL